MIMIANRDKPLLNYEDALLYVSLLDIDGHHDWRLPKVEEMNDITNDIDDKFGFHWTSDVANDDRNYVVNVSGTYKRSALYWKHFVIAVRDM